VAGDDGRNSNRLDQSRDAGSTGEGEDEEEGHERRRDRIGDREIPVKNSRNSRSILPISRFPKVPETMAQWMF